MQINEEILNAVNSDKVPHSLTTVREFSVEYYKWVIKEDIKEYISKHTLSNFVYCIYSSSLIILLG